MTPLIQAENLSFSYPSSQSKVEKTLEGIHLCIEEGEFVAIVGANGSGKTTLLKHLNGSLRPQQGRVLINGWDTRDNRFLRQIRQQVGMVFQFPEDQVISTTVEDDVAFGLENLALPSREIRERVDSVLKLVGLWDERKRPPHLLSAGQMQRLAFAGVIAMQPRCILFDEATTMLDPAGRRTVLTQMQHLNAQGVCIVYVTHLMEEAALAKRVVVMDHGKIVLDGIPEDIFSSAASLEQYHLRVPAVTSLANLMRKWFTTMPAPVFSFENLMKNIPDWKGIFPQYQSNGITESRVSESQPAAIEVCNLSHTYLSGTPMAQRALTSSNLTVYHGRSHGFAGATGSGKSTLLQHLNGILRPQEGTIRVLDFLLHQPQVLTRDVVRKVGLVFQNPEMQFFETYVGDEIAYGARQFPGSDSVSTRVRRAMQWVGLDFDKFKDRPVYTLSGGEKRKAALASAMVLEPKILLLDEPTAGLDPLAREEIIHSLKHLQDQNTLLVLSSHHMEDLVELTPDVTIFQSGKDVLTGSLVEVFSKESEVAQAGLELPIAARLAAGLKYKNYPIPPGIISMQSLYSFLDGLMAGEYAAV